VLPLAATLAPLSGGRGVSVSVPIPAGSDRNSQVVINGVTVARQPVVYGLSSPMTFSIFAGMLAPLILKGASSGFGVTPVITSDGTLYVPNQNNPSFQVFSADGTPLLPLSVTSVGLSDQMFHASFGIAVLPQQGVVIVSSFHYDMLHVHGLSDGIRIASVEVSWCTFLASDPAAATIYVSSESDDDGAGHSVVAYTWNTTTLVVDGIVEAAGVTDNLRPLAVMPPAPGLRTSYLIVGIIDTPTLHVISLPDRRLIHTHTLEGMEVVGLAADPFGTALAVCDFASKAVHVLPWPLPGMHALT
jgi:hypothetical protein